MQIGWPFFCSIFGAATHLYWQISAVDIHDPVDCNAKYLVSLSSHFVFTEMDMPIEVTSNLVVLIFKICFQQVVWSNRVCGNCRWEVGCVGQL